MQPAYGADPDRYQVIPRVLVIVTHGGRVLLIRRAQHKKLWPGKYNAPGGHIERGEDPEQAGRRELLEETGVQVETLQLRGMIVAEAGLSGTGILVFIYQGETNDAALRASEEGEPVWAHPGQLSELDLVSDSPLLFDLALNQPDFFYVYKIPTEDGGEEVQGADGFIHLEKQKSEARDRKQKNNQQSTVNGKRNTQHVTRNTQHATRNTCSRRQNDANRYQYPPRKKT